jgi:hypothetical protein
MPDLFLHSLRCPGVLYSRVKTSGPYHFPLKSYKNSAQVTYFQRWIIVAFIFPHPRRSFIVISVHLRNFIWYSLRSFVLDSRRSQKRAFGKIWIYLFISIYSLELVIHPWTLAIKIKVLWLGITESKLLKVP